ncbi:MAG: methionyl-tRNA formyltransferase [Burkholderiaceae bacterium]
MNLVFAGTPEFAAHALAALIFAGHEIVLVMTQPDRPAGRGLQVHASAVKALAVRHRIPVIQPMGLRLGGRYDADARAARDRLTSTTHDAMIVAAYGLILPESVLTIPSLGCINIHASLLPRWRGAAPIQRAIESGDTTTGVTIMQMDAGLDTGPLLLERAIAIDPSDTAATLTTRLASLGGDAIVQALPLLQAGRLPPRPQHAADDESEVTYAAKLSKSEATLDFTLGSRRLVDRMRAFDPWPGCTAELESTTSRGGCLFKMWHAEIVPPRVLTTLIASAAATPRPGQILALVDDATADQALAGGSAVVIATGDGAIAVTELQKPGGKRLPARHFARELRDAGALCFATGRGTPSA